MEEVFSQPRPGCGWLIIIDEVQALYRKNESESGDDEYKVPWAGVLWGRVKALCSAHIDDGIRVLLLVSYPVRFLPLSLPLIPG